MAQTREVEITAMTLRFTDPYVIRAIDHAAQLCNQTRTGFLLSAAQEKAEKIIRDSSETRSEIEPLLISRQAYENVMDRLDRPKKPAKRLVKAMKDYSEWSKKNGFTETD